MMQRISDETSDDPRMARAKKLISSLPEIDQATLPIPKFESLHSGRRFGALMPMRLAFAAIILCAGIASAAVVSIAWRPSAPAKSQPLTVTVSVSIVPSADGQGVDPSVPNSANITASASASTSPATHAESESDLVWRAVRALRKDQKPQQALALAERYLRLYPRGVQREVVLVVAMQAAQEAGDMDKARGFAKDYLAAYPTAMRAEQARRLLRTP